MRRPREARPPRRPRVLTWRLVLVALVVGVVLAVASVVIGAVVAQRGVSNGYLQAGADRFYDPSALATYTLWRAPWFTRWVGDRGQFLSGETAVLYAQLLGGRPVEASPMPASANAVLDAGALAVDHVSVGWPWRAAWGVQAGHLRSPPATNRGVWNAAAFGSVLSIPYLPLWPGLLGNTLFYGALALIPIGLLRRRTLRRRARRGLCVACCYELGEGVSACPECGLAAVGPPRLGFEDRAPERKP